MGCMPRTLPTGPAALLQAVGVWGIITSALAFYIGTAVLSMEVYGKVGRLRACADVYLFAHAQKRIYVTVWQAARRRAGLPAGAAALPCAGRACSRCATPGCMFRCGSGRLRHAPTPAQRLARPL